MDLPDPYELPPLLLTRAEVAELTGLTRPDAQMRWLKKEGWIFALNGAGRVVIARLEFERKMASGAGPLSLVSDVIRRTKPFKLNVEAMNANRRPRKPNP